VSRDPWRNYDAWKTTDHDAEDRDARDAYEAAHTTYTTRCCGDVLDGGDLEFDASGAPLPVVCESCGETSGVHAIVDEPEDDRDDDDFGRYET
jgi:hypothetical protein